MNANLNTEGLQIPLCEKTLRTEVAGDFSLPDYQPEIKRLLRIRPCVLPASHYAGSGNADFSGTLDYYVLYMGNDGGLYCAPIHTEYGFAVPFEQGEAQVELCMADVVPESVVGRVSAPRKLSIRCRLRADVSIMGTLPASESTQGVVDPFSVERLMGEQVLAQIGCGQSEVLRQSEDILVDGQSGDVRLICAEGQVHVQEVSCTEGQVHCRGEVVLRLMLSREQQGSLPDPVPMHLVRKLAFTGSIPCTVATPGAECCVMGEVGELSVSVEPSFLHAEVGVVLQARVMSNRPASFIKDIFSTKKQAECRYDSYALPVAIRSLGGNFTQSDSASLAENGMSVGSIVDVCGSAEAEQLQWENGKCTLSGMGHYIVLMADGGEVSAHEIELPWRYEFDCEREPGEWRAHMQVLSCRARVDGERIGIDAELACAIRTWETGQVSVLREVSFAETAHVRPGTFVVCYPGMQDSLWSVAKRYGSSLSTVRQANSLSADAPADDPASIEGCKYLIV